MRNSAKLRQAALGVFLGLSLAGSAWANGSPSSVKIKIYGVAISQNADCSNPQMVSYNPSGTTYDVTQNPALLSGNIAAGTYNCVIMIMDDEITFVPSSNVGTNCAAGQTYSRLICSQNSSCQVTNFSIDSQNDLAYTSVTSANATNSQDLSNVQKVLLFLSTGSTGTGMHAFLQPTAATNGIQLNGAFVVSQNGNSGTFVVNFNNQIMDTGSDCDLEPPAFSFR